MPLTNVKILGAKPADKAFKLHDSGGLFLLVRPSGAKLWRFSWVRVPLDFLGTDFGPQLPQC
jgi:hypothetical protein